MRIIMAAKEAIRKVRIALCLNQKEFADLVRINKQSISYYEMGKRKPTFPIIRKIVDAVNGLNKEGIHLNYTDLMDEEYK